MTFSAKFDRPTVLAAGAYTATLVDISDCTMQFQDKPPMQGLSFQFGVDTTKGLVEIKRDVTKTISDRGNLYKMLRSMLGEMLTTEVLNSDERLAMAVNYCIGKQYIITVEVNPKGYSRVVAVSALPAGAAGHGPAAQVASSHMKLKAPAGQSPATGFEGYPDARPEPVSQLPDAVKDDDLPF